MQNQKSLIVAVVVIGLFIVAGFFISQSMDKMADENTQALTGTDQNPTEQTLTQAQRENIVTTYIKAKITELSPAPAVLGGTFYVTNIVFSGANIGSVEYEDGHIALVADFSYTIDEAIITQGESAVQVTFSNVRE